MELHKGNKILNVVLDHHDNNVYWLEYVDNFETCSKKIRYTDLNGIEVKTFNITGFSTSLRCTSYIEVDEKYVYFEPYLFTGSEHLRRARKVDGLYDKDFYMVEMNPLRHSNICIPFTLFLILTGQPQEIAMDHPCKNDNGGCEEYCVAVPDENKKLMKKCLYNSIVP